MASSAPRIPVSMLLTDKSGEEEPKKKSREDWRKAKELEEARKAGTAPAAVDEEGRDINPHIPQYISAAPWYYGTSDPTLKHQRPQDEKYKEVSGIDEWYKRGVDTSKVVTKYRKGACENCGAITHKRKDCMERPRKVGAKFNSSKIAPDEFIQTEINADYDGKRDRWAGYDPESHREIIEEYQKIEDAKRQLRAEKLKENPDAVEEDDDEEAGDEDKYVDEMWMPGTKVDSKQRITVRNLRIREDTAKYLRNLDPNSAYYDPKTRSMRDNPNPQLKSEEVDFAGENFVRFSGDTQKHAEAQLFAWEAYGKGVDVHVLAEPTKLELLQSEYEKKKEQFKSTVKDSILDRYGGEEHLQAPPKALLLAQTENYVEYARDGKVIRGQEKPIIRSRYAEDVYINNHTSVWGSYWRAGEWGYKCCHSFIKNSYCVGDTGKGITRNNVPSASFTSAELLAQTTAQSAEMAVAVVQKTLERENGNNSSNSSSDSEKESEAGKAKKKMSKKKKQKEKKREKRRRAEADKNEDKLAKALAAEEAHNKKVEQLLKLDERKRPYNSMFDVKEPTEEEKEAFMIKRPREDDPMMQFLSKK